LIRNSWVFVSVNCLNCWWNFVTQKQLDICFWWTYLLCMFVKYCLSQKQQSCDFVLPLLCKRGEEHHDVLLCGHIRGMDPCWLASMANRHCRVLLCDFFHKLPISSLCNQGIGGWQAYPMNETKDIAGLKPYILQSIDAILVYIVTHWPCIKGDRSTNFINKFQNLGHSIVFTNKSSGLRIPQLLHIIHTVYSRLLHASGAKQDGIL
jgi:hypothetical protein